MQTPAQVLDLGGQSCYTQASQSSGVPALAPWVLPRRCTRPNGAFLLSDPIIRAPADFINSAEHRHKNTMCRCRNDCHFVSLAFATLRPSQFDQMRDGVEVERVRFATEAQRFEWNRAAAREHIEHARTRCASCFDVFSRHLLAALGGQALRVRLQDESLRLLDFVARTGIRAEVGNKVRRRRALRHERAEHRGAARDEQTPRPPQVQRADVSLSHGFLASRFGRVGYASSS